MSKQRIKREVDIEKGAMNFTIIETGKTVVANIDAIFGKGTFETLKKIDGADGVLVRTVLHGLNGKVGDSAADPKVSSEEQLTATIKQLVEKTWAQRSAGGGGKSNLLVEALMRETGQDKEAVEKKLSGKSDAEKKALREHAQVKKHIDAITQERANARAKASAAKAGEAEALSF